ncbi:recombinase RecT [Peribacillus frigoritolerans]|uniref:recombinase RecT n=1 Tax=Peribacillus frigoritolerans TaxID=450367 RepID=UPI0032B40124
MVNQVNTKDTKSKLQQKTELANDKSQVGNPAKPGKTFKDLLEAPNVKSRFEETLKQRSGQFMTSILSLYNNDQALKEADPVSVIQSAMMAASLDLPIEKNFGYAWIIAYKDWKSGKTIAQFQMGYKGYIQLALRSNQYKKINVIPVYEGELTKFDRLTEEFELDYDKRKSDAVIGYAAYFELLSGFKKTVYWPKDQVEMHRQKFNKAKDKKSMNNVWRDDYDAMAMKTVLTYLLKKWGILSVDLQQAIINDETQERKEINEEFADVDFPFDREVNPDIIDVSAE